MLWGVDDCPMPKHLWTLDGRLFWWYYTPSTSEVSTFMVGHEHVTVDEGLRVLSDHAHGCDGKLLGPVRPSPKEAVGLRKRPNRGRRG